MRGTRLQHLCQGVLLLLVMTGVCWGIGGVGGNNGGGGGGTVDLSAPGDIGGGTPGKGYFTDLSATGTVVVGTTKRSSGTGSPEGVVTGSPGDTFNRTDGGSGTTLYVKESGSATNTGWVAYSASGSYDNLSCTAGNVPGTINGTDVVCVPIDSNLASVSANDDSLPSAKAVKQKIQYKSWSFDPKAVCDGAVDRLFIMSAHGGQGFVITAWKLSFEADPTTEVDLDLKRADAWIGVANSAVMDVLDTTNGASSESTAANINGGAAVAEGKVIYLEFGTAYTEANHQVIFEMWFYEVGS